MKLRKQGNKRHLKGPSELPWTSEQRVIKNSCIAKTLQT